jgi:hypothetical protein
VKNDWGFSLVMVRLKAQEKGVNQVDNRLIGVFFKSFIDS